ncbi:hypothetical protein GCM10022235_13050 [Kribbella ginsengisoli]|uniref:Uncharacterized protein n=1 Tax=Kribbella ginsengisoli TaxID=363865 RepID=A0ABP6W9N5_9ACTN
MQQQNQRSFPLLDDVHGQTVDAQLAVNEAQNELQSKSPRGYPVAQSNGPDCSVREATAWLADGESARR